MDKDADAYRTISEVAQALDIPPHVLRFWETKFPQVKPLKRGGGRRYYRRSDTDLLRMVRRLLYEEGYTIRGVQQLLKARKGVASTACDAQSSTAWPALSAAAPLQTLTDLSHGEGGVAAVIAEIAVCRAILRAALRGDGHGANAPPERHTEPIDR